MITWGHYLYPWLGLRRNSPNQPNLHHKLELTHYHYTKRFTSQHTHVRISFQSYLNCQHLFRRNTKNSLQDYCFNVQICMTNPKTEYPLPGGAHRCKARGQFIVLVIRYVKFEERERQPILNRK